ncbi:MAG: pantoate--beta-alanine ligase [Acetobacteraceae bacterium]
MRVAKTREELLALRADLPEPVGLVPTMGALHAGHVALVEAARGVCASTIASIFVNPTQFSDAQAVSAYPKDTQGDLAKLEAAGCDAVFLPDVEALYPPGDATTIVPAGPALDWEGRFRPGHFVGMATVVAKLFGLVRPDVAVFGEKDWQQLQVVRRMVADLLLPVRILGVATVREADGLAMSSRNRLLNPAQRVVAGSFHPGLHWVVAALRAGRAAELALDEGRADLERSGFGVDYLALVDALTLQPCVDVANARLLAAVRLGTVRLLDNVGLSAT